MRKEKTLIGCEAVDFFIAFTLFSFFESSICDGKSSVIRNIFSFR